MSDMEECRQALLDSFDGSWFNYNDEFIADTKSNTYLIFSNCETPLDVECKVLEWFSRSAFKTEPYSQEWRNRNFHMKMLKGINSFLDTTLNEDSMEEIYTRLGNAVNHQLTIQFILSEYDMKVLKGGKHE